MDLINKYSLIVQRYHKIFDRNRVQVNCSYTKDFTISSINRSKKFIRRNNTFFLSIIAIAVSVYSLISIFLKYYLI
uniref:Uncharacterized protein n=1 Tax=Octopus bimaculoides TaxID=37653 RepID=A0A0L8FV92_OCTBM